MPRGMACGCGSGIGQGSLLPGAGLACRPSSLGYEGCLIPSTGRMVRGGFRVCGTRRWWPLVASRGVMACCLPWGPRDFLGLWSQVSPGLSLLAWGPRDGPDAVPLHGCTDAEGSALVPQPVLPVHFVRAIGPHECHERFGHVVPLAG